MLKFAANLTYLFNEYTLFDRFKASADAGFAAVEYQFPYNNKPELYQKQLQKYNLEFVLINAPAGNFSEGDRGLAGLPGREEEYKIGIKKAITYAKDLSCPRIHVMAGIKDPSTSMELFRATLINNLKYASDACAYEGIKVLIEPLNRIDVPGYFVDNFTKALDLLNEINSKNLYLQYDLYHGGVNKEPLIKIIKNNFNLIEHIQVAGVPGRREPNVGIIDFYNILKRIDNLGYNGWIGCEYSPLSTTSKGLKWRDKL